MNIGKWVENWDRIAPEKTAVIDDGHAVSFAQFNAGCNQICHFLLDKGLRKGDFVGVLMYNCHEYLEIYAALAKIGAILVPLNWRMAPPELAFVLNDCAARFLFFHAEYLDTAESLREMVPSLEKFIALPDTGVPWAGGFEKISRFSTSKPQPAREPDAEDPHILMYTSGTTGTPKGVLMSHRKTFYNALNANIYYSMVPEDIMLVHRPLFHSGGLLVNVTPGLYKGVTIIIKKRFSPQECLDTIKEYNVTIFEAAATLLNFILHECEFSADDFRTTRSLYTGGERIPPSLLESYLRKGIPVSQIFGMTETSTLTYLSGSDAIRKHGSVGKAVFHAEVKILNPDKQSVKPGEKGEIMARGPILMSGYLNRPDLTAEVMDNGWYRTGDIATVDDEGYIYIVDRLKDKFISGGENIYPAEIEKHLLANPKIFDAAVYGVPDPRWGEVPMASIVLKENTELTALEVREFLNGKVGKFKIPKHIEFMESLPRTESGKIKRYVLIENFTNRNRS